MLIHIYIRDLVTIEELDLHFQGGTTMITGESGAGKSIVIEAMELALGGRSSAHLIRPGKERADISLCFDISTLPEVNAWLKQKELQGEQDECIIRRLLLQDGRTKSYINNIPSTLQSVRELSEQLFHLHGQHEQQFLLRTEMQRSLVDRFAKAIPLTIQLKHLVEEWKLLDAKRLKLLEQAKEGSERSNYLQYLQTELSSAEVRLGEWDQLEATQRKLSHVEELAQTIEASLQVLSCEDGPSLIKLLNQLRKRLESIQQVDIKINSWLSTLDSVYLSITDLETELENYLDATDLNPARLQQIEDRMTQLYDLARKHKIPPQDLPLLEAQFSKELNTLASYDQELAELIKQQKKLEANYHDIAAQLSKIRQKAAPILAKEITRIMRSLALPHCEFHIQLETKTGEISPYGYEHISFLIKTNPEQELLPLAKVISGGELSRLSLALHLSLSNEMSVPTLIFDEVDSGLSGRTAEKIGKLLRQLGEHFQVFCITHQAQVAAASHHHLLVEKQVSNKVSRTRLRLLQLQEKTQEIARLLGGEKLTQKTLEHAAEILASQEQ
jgi:DNA repair protein RecN (Recombination protein N)